MLVPSVTTLVLGRAGVELVDGQRERAGCEHAVRSAGTGAERGRTGRHTGGGGGAGSRAHAHAGGHTHSRARAHDRDRATPTPASPVAAQKPAAPRATTPAAPAVATAAAAGAPVAVKPRVDAPARLKAAQAKFDSGLYEQALADAREMVAEAPAAASAPAAQLLIGRTLERQRKPDDAMAAYVELRSTHKTAPEAAPATLALAELVLRSKLRDRERTARTLFDEVATAFPASAEAPIALVRRASLEEKDRTRVMDKELATSVQPQLVTYRTVVENYPSAPAAEVAHEKLAALYEDLKRL